MTAFTVENFWTPNIFSQLLRRRGSVMPTLLSPQHQVSNRGGRISKISGRVCNTVNIPQ